MTEFCLEFPIAVLIAQAAHPKKTLPLHRKEPIPRTAKRRPRLFWFWRSPRTQATRRASRQLCDVGTEVDLAQVTRKLGKVRALRTLPDDRSERPRSHYRNFNWKRFRSKQFRSGTDTAAARST